MRISLVTAAALAVAFIATAAITMGSNDSAAPVVEEPEVTPEVTASPEDRLRLPGGRVALCDEKASVVADCEHWEYLDPEWSVTRILTMYPYFDPEEAAAKIWLDAYSRHLFEITRNPAQWSPTELAEHLATRNQVETKAATRIYAPSWRKYATGQGYRDQMAWRREVFEGIHERVSDKEDPAIPDCEELQRILEDGTDCEVYLYLSREWTIERVIAEFDGFTLADTDQIRFKLRSDANDRFHMLRHSNSGYSWDPDRLPEQLASQSLDRVSARARLAGVGEDFSELFASTPAGRPELGPLVWKCRRGCYEIEDSDLSSKCYETCDATDFAADLDDL